MTRKLDDIAPYPRTEEEATAKAIYRHLLVGAQVTYLTRTRAGAKPDPQIREANVRDLTLHVTEWGLLRLLRRAMGLDPAATADDAARDLWVAWDDGSACAELLWEWLTEAGIDPEEIWAIVAGPAAGPGA